MKSLFKIFLCQSGNSNKRCDIPGYLISNPGLKHMADQIFGYLDIKTVGKCRIVSKQWRQFLEKLFCLIAAFDAAFHPSKTAKTHLSTDKTAQCLLSLNSWTIKFVASFPGLLPHRPLQKSCYKWFVEISMYFDQDGDICHLIRINQNIMRTYLKGKKA